MPDYICSAEQSEIVDLFFDYVNQNLWENSDTLNDNFYFLRNVDTNMNSCFHILFYESFSSANLF